jgi:PhnB protein
MIQLTMSGILDSVRCRRDGNGPPEDRDGCDNPSMSTEGAMPQPTVQAQLSVRNGRAAVDFYKVAFGAVEVYRFGGTDDLPEVVAQLAVGNSLFWVEDESPPHKNFSPETVGGATVRMLLIVDDPTSVLKRAVAAGASEVNSVGEEHGWQLGRIDDPFGHRWEIGKPVSQWPPPDSHPSSDQSTLAQ